MKTLKGFLIDRVTGVTEDKTYDFGFVKTDVKKLFNAYAYLNPGEFKVFIKMLQIMNWGNQIRKTYPQLSQEAGVCENTVKLAIKKLRLHNYIKRESTSSYMVNPEVACRVNPQKRMTLLHDYKDIDDNKEK